MDNSVIPNNDLVSAVGRTMAVLEALAEHPEESGVSEIATKLDMSKATVYRFLQSLKARGYVVQDAEDRYRLSVRLFELGAQALPHLDIVREAEPGMRRINELTGETVHLGILDEGSIVYVHKIDSKYNLRMYSRIGRRAPLYCTGIGKVLMAWLEEDELLAHLAQESFERRTANTLTSVEAYLQELEIVRRQGYAEDHEEFEDNMRCLAAPIRDRFGHVIGGMSVSFPCFRFREELKQDYVRQLMHATQQISSQLGWHAG
ncbi:MULTISPECIES: DNA-binding transcriptional regulator KdgR [Pseudomonas]|uniref:DNA-binding transcriptional regulator KdgR n=1 Tax=Pseudomonas TaxID=286 RepID=UPI00034982B5|nr:MULTISPECIES: DNA-binding transcriptional regulator KdgR [Pseudomonas]UVM70108.1 DNA-binding transcriptional regulator KdgR [Pseudomonas canavaninivorans]